MGRLIETEIVEKKKHIFGNKNLYPDNSVMVKMTCKWIDHTYREYDLCVLLWKGLKGFGKGNIWVISRSADIFIMITILIMILKGDYKGYRMTVCLNLWTCVCLCLYVSPWVWMCACVCICAYVCVCSYVCLWIDWNPPLRYWIIYGYKLNLIIHRPR